MYTALGVTSPDHLLAPSDRHTPHAHVLSPPKEQPLAAALTETQSLLEQHGYLVTVYPATLPTAFRHRLHTVRSLLESRRIALLPVELPPLASGVLVRQLRQLSLCDLTPGVLGAAARLLTHYVYAGAVLGSVAKLDRVPVAVTSHARSWLPGNQFAVLAAPTSELVRLGTSGAEEGLTGPQFATQLTVAPGQLSSEWAMRTLPARWRVGQVEEARLPRDSPVWWGTARLTEFVAAIPDVSVLYQLVASVRRDECHGCGLELIGDRCAFCATPLPSTPADRPAPPASQAPPAPAASAMSPASEAPPVPSGRPAPPAPSAPAASQAPPAPSAPAMPVASQTRPVPSGRPAPSAPSAPVASQTRSAPSTPLAPSTAPAPPSPAMPPAPPAPPAPSTAPAPPAPAMPPAPAASAMPAPEAPPASPAGSEPVVADPRGIRP